MTSRPLEIQTDTTDGTVTLKLIGDIGYPEATNLRESLRVAQSGSPSKLIVDLSQVDYMNTPGLATLVEALQNTRRRNAKMVLCGLTTKVRSIFEIAKLNKVFTIAETLESAAAI
jgi:anti-sigma B factor antagonist